MRKMLHAVFAALLMTVVTSSAGNAAPVSFLGSVTNPANPLFANGTQVALDLDFTPAAGLTAVVNSATLRIGGQTWSSLIGGGNQLAITTNGAANDDLNIQLSFSSSTPGGLGSIASAMTLTIFGANDLGAAPDATAFNVGLLARNGNPGSGALFLLGGPGVPGAGTFVNFSGTAVPEPGTMLLLGGLGCVVAGRSWRRRRQQAKAE